MISVMWAPMGLTCLPTHQRAQRFQADLFLLQVLGAQACLMNLSASCESLWSIQRSQKSSKLPARDGPEGPAGVHCRCTGIRACDGPDRADLHNISTGADASWVDPDMSPGSTNPVGSRLSPQEPGRSKGQVTELRGRTVDERRRVRNKDTEDESRRPVRTQESRRPLGPTAPLEYGTGSTAQRQDGGRKFLAVGGFLPLQLLCGVSVSPSGRIIRTASDWGTPAYIRGNYSPSGITRGISRSSLGDLGNSGHNGRGFLVLTFVILLAPRGKQRRIAPKVARGSRLKPGSQERRPLDPQPPALGGGGFPGIAALETPAADSDFGSIRDAAELIVDGDSTGPGRLASLDSEGLPQVKTDVGGSRSLDTHKTTITAQHKETQRDSKKARVATKQLQVAVSKVAKTCSEIGERIAAIECRADVLESDLGAVTKQAAMHETQLSDIQWKVEDFENRQRRNNLCLIGIQEALPRDTKRSVKDSPTGVSIELSQKREQSALDAFASRTLSSSIHI
ncbi:hypothetical protein NDU88_007418 [Pleurodeles waltl]|uniref:Uncharacterized protein n=1 Tax=Pleurodeles waltl TaxID=8319 RepID=A0AAV7M2V3_PLEWA|nr:hypothetical protein NDU88_007418 [Pleurodeles waltl]